MNKLKNKITVIAIAVLMFVSLSNAVLARNIANYNFNLPRFLGSSQTNALKKTGLSKAVNNNTYIGGGYKMYSRVYSNKSGNILTDEATQNSGDRVLLKYRNPEDARGTYVYTRMWTAYDVIVKVSAYGSWSPDTE
ncbi:hypothetical protein [Helcococcus kunzii]|uniref:hypothetical protein n=1 Tax=Helcococcus kunzii TaxID=40091 RepID=UPI0024AD1AF9|nr:hypothetical protein [Helcococcus kunzii]